MWLVTLKIWNPNNVPYDPENSVYIKSYLFVEDGARPIEANAANSWIAIKGGLGCRMGPGAKHETSLLVPAGANSCRASLKYTHAVMYGGGLARLARRPPRFFSRLPNSFWQWAGFSRYRPSSDWREINIEVPFPSVALPLPKPGDHVELFKNQFVRKNSPEHE
jgi:hypothetical protein